MNSCSESSWLNALDNSVIVAAYSSHSPQGPNAQKGRSPFLFAKLHDSTPTDYAIHGVLA